MVRRARSQSVPAEEFVDRGPGKIMCTEGVSWEGEPLLLSGDETSCSSVWNTSRATYSLEVVCQVWTRSEASYGGGEVFFLSMTRLTVYFGYVNVLCVILKLNVFFT
jgi:hypothetical protein